MINKRWLATAVLIAIALAVMFSADRYERLEAGQRDRLELTHDTLEVRNRLTDSIHDRLIAIDATRAFLLSNDSLPTQTQFDSFATTLLQNEVSIRALQYADENTVIRYTTPLTGNEAAVGLQLRKSTNWPFVKKAIRTRRITVSDPVELVQGGTGVVARMPLYRGDKFLGLAQGVFDVPTIISEATTGSDTGDFAVRVRDSQGHVFYGPESFAYGTEDKVISVGDRTWTITVGWKVSPPAPSPVIRGVIWGLGIALTLALAFILNLIMGRARRWERAATMSEDRYRRLFDNANDAIFVHDRNGQIVDVNEAACKRLGYTRDELLGLHTHDLAPPEYAASTTTRIETLEQQGGLVFEVIQCHKDGTLIPVEVSARLIEVEGEPLVQSFARDISRRKQVEARQDALMEINSRLLLGEEIEAVLPFICQQVVDLYDLKFAWIGFKEPDGTVRPAGAHGIEENYLANIHVRWDDTPEGQGPTGTAIRTGEPNVMNDIVHDPHYALWREQALARGYASSAAIPLRDDGHVLGTLNVYAAHPHAFDDTTVKQLTGFAQQATIALMAARSRQQLAESEAHYRTLTEQSLVGVYLVQDGLFRYVNPALAKAFGYTPDELTDRLGPVDLTAPKDRARVLENLRRRVEGEVQAIHYTFIGLRKDGSKFNVEVAGSAMQYQGRPAILGTLRDITEREKAQAKLLRRAQQMQLVNEVGRQLISLREQADLPERIVEQVSQAFGYYATTLFLYNEAADHLEVVSACGEYTIPVPAGYSVPLGKGMCGHAAQSRQTQFVADVSTDPHYFPYEGLPKTSCELSVPLLAGDRLVGVLDIQEQEIGALDDTDRQTMEAIAGQVAIALENAHLYTQIRRQVRDLDVLNRITVAATSSLDETSVLNIVCAELARALGVPQAAAALFNEERTVATVVAEYLEPGRPSAMDATIPATGNPSTEYILRHHRPLAIADVQTDERMAPVRDLMARRGTASLLIMPLIIRNQVIGTLGLDAIERREFSDDEVALARNVATQTSQALENARLYQELQRAMEKLRAVQVDTLRTARLQALGQMASGVVHDFNNILTSVLGYAELLLRDADITEQNRDFVERIRRAGINARSSIDRLRDFYRPRDERDPREMVDLCELVRNTLDLTEPRWRDQPQQHGVVVDVRTELTPLPWVPANPEELREMLINLIFNAVDAMPNGGILTLRTYPQDEWAVLEVADTGTGMDADVRDHLFEPFFTTKGEAGTGLGLAMVHGTAQRHNGHIEVESAPNKGSSFKVFLPTKGEVRYSEAEKPGTQLPSCNILLIDDDPSVRDTVSMLLIAMGHRVTTARSGAEGLDFFQQSDFDLVITDLGMPGLSGREVIAEVKAQRPGIPVILLTGWGKLMDLQQDTPTGADIVTSKPISYAELEHALNEVMRDA
ncbi:MAG: GAF domain-containing protein [Chloroflexi bacterium]|nr:GAF domain-containing protein [Chloroflexota bacterium]